MWAAMNMNVMPTRRLDSKATAAHVGFAYNMHSVLLAQANY